MAFRAKLPIRSLGYIDEIDAETLEEAQAWLKESIENNGVYDAVDRIEDHEAVLEEVEFERIEEDDEDETED